MVALIFSRPDGQWFDFPPMQMAAASGNHLTIPSKSELIELPEGATLTMMPLAAPIGMDQETGQFLALDENPYKKRSEPVYAVAALLPQGFTRTYMPAATTAEQTLPLLGYTAVGSHKGKLYVAAAATDEHQRWAPRHYNSAGLPQLIAARRREFPGNRIIEQLAHCALEYGCFTAQNIFYRRWEGGIPVSPACNAACLCCISEQPEGGAGSPQQRIGFCPEAQEIAAVAIAHLQQAEQPIISFGQGCEGEPSLAYTQIAAAIRLIRGATERGLININTNAGATEAVRELLEAGMDSFRVSLFSPIADEYMAYHQPRDYAFADVLRSLRLMRERGRQVSLNLLTYPGFTDDRRRLDALCGLVQEMGIRQIQLRNLNCDPSLMQDFCAASEPLGMLRFIYELQKRLPEVRLGNYSRDLR
ncbi:MAG: radical SAM protein [Bacillota bacterium]|nr:radical SAM protein [Bacillota bacterium]